MIKIFRKKDKAVGKDKKKFIKKIDIFNYAPIPYALTEGFWKYKTSAEKVYAHRLNSFPAIDDLNHDIFDPEIDAECSLETVRGMEQYVNHLSSIDSYAGIINGEIEKATLTIKQLENDHGRILPEIEKIDELLKKYEEGGK